jgi:hypothetical protein
MRINAIIAVLAMAILVAACGTVPIQNVANNPVSSASGKPLSTEDVRGAIVRAGAALGWEMKDESPGHLSAKLMLRTHEAVIDIPYSPTSYSIKYRSSVNLNEKDGNIHKNYNGWIQNLTRGINAQISAL